MSGKTEKTEKGHDKPEEGEDDRWKSQKEQIKSKW